MAQFPYLPMFVESWVTATVHLTLAQEGAYFRLLALMWITPGCRIPNDNGWLQAHLRVTKDELRDVVRPVIDEFCRVEGNFILQKRLQKEWLRVHRTVERLSALGKRPKTNAKGISSA